MTRALEQLIAKCHEFAVGVSIGGQGAEFWEDVRRNLCDELEAALALPGEPEQEIRDCILAVKYIGTAGELILEIEGVFFRVNVSDQKLGPERIAAIHRFTERQRKALAALPGGRESKEEPVLTAEQVLAEVERQERAQTAQEEK